MLYLGIDQHSKQITVCVRNQAGEIVLRRQVSTLREKMDAFFDEFRKIDSDFMAILEVCGFNDWLIAWLDRVGCREIVLIHPDKTSKKKTDRRDANKLCELLWLNRERLANGQRVQGLRRVYIPTQQEQEDRQLTALRKRIGQLKTRTINKLKGILRRHNLIWDYPTKTFQTKSGRKWLAEVELPAMDRMEVDMLLAQWKLWDEQIAELDTQIEQRSSRKQPEAIMSNAQILMTAPGVSHYSGLSIVSRIGDITRFPRPRSLANYFGLTPGCRNSGNKQDRLGSITKEGSSMVRFILGQLVIHVLKQDAVIRKWYQRIKRRRGSKIARVAVMRRLCTIFWHMLTHQERYQPGGTKRLRAA
jgi:transposase